MWQWILNFLKEPEYAPNSVEALVKQRTCHYRGALFVTPSPQVQLPSIGVVYKRPHLKLVDKNHKS